MNMTEAYRKRQEATVVSGRIGKSDMCRVFPLLSGTHSSAEADAIKTEAQYQGEFPVDADPADLGLPTKVSRVRGLD